MPPRPRASAQHWEGEGLSAGGGYCPQASRQALLVKLAGREHGDPWAPVTRVHTQGDYKVYASLTWVQVGGWSPLCREHTSPTRGRLSQHTRAEGCREGSGEGLRGYEASKEPERNSEGECGLQSAEQGGSQP